MPRFFNPQSLTKHGVSVSAAFAGSVTLFLSVMAIMASPAAEAQVVRHTTVAPRAGVVHSRTVIVDRGRPGWWRGHPDLSIITGRAMAIISRPATAITPSRPDMRIAFGSSVAPSPCRCAIMSSSIRSAMDCPQHRPAISGAMRERISC